MVHKFRTRTKNMENKVCVIGMGYVGLTLSGVCLRSGHNVLGVELQDEVRKNINNGKSHFHEPGLNKILKSSETVIDPRKWHIYE